MKPKYKIGQILMMACFVPPDLYEGEPVAVIGVRSATNDIRYQVKRISLEKIAWVDEATLVLPIGKE